MNERRSTVLLGENREGSDSSVKELLEQRNIEVLECADGIEAVRKSFAKKPDLIILDVMMPRLNGYQFARLLKNDPLMSNTPIIHMGSSKNPIEQYWSRVCGGDDYLHKPVNEMDLDKTLHKLLHKESGKRRLLAPISPIPELEDYSILSLAANLLEHELLRANILNEINMIDISAMSTKDLVMALMAIINSLYDFSLGTALLLYDNHGEFFFYQNGQVEQSRLDEVKGLIFKHLQRQHKIYSTGREIKQTILQSTQHKEVIRETDEVYIYTKERGTVRSVLAFENIGFEELKKDEQGIIRLALELINGVLEKKILFEVSQELSIIDAVTEGYSMPFFMAVLGREIGNAVRKGYPMTLITIAISNFGDITKDLSANDVDGLIRVIHNLILRVTRKSDIVARWEMASFAFLLTQSTLEKARVVQDRISNYITKNLSRYLPSPAKLVIDMGISQFDPERDQTPEGFFAQAKPKGTPERGQAEGHLREREKE